MTIWPQRGDYQNAVHRPERAFRDPHLQSCEVERDRMKRPYGVNGAFAIVFRLQGRSGDYRAVRFFLGEGKQRGEYFRRVEAHLRQARPRCLVNFGYDDQGVRVRVGEPVREEWFPLLTMDWVSGEKLMPWIDLRMAQGAADDLRRLAESWRLAMSELAEKRIAHGDLHHDNIFIAGDRPVLVDYDDMFVESIADLETTRGAGMPAYQHPQRGDGPAGLGLDDFSAWVIWLALRGIAADPSLWERFVVDIDNDNLLFTEDDHKRPDESAVWDALEKSPDEHVGQWAARIRRTLPDQPCVSVPRFDPQRKATTVTRPTTITTPIPPEPPRPPSAPGKDPNIPKVPSRPTALAGSVKSVAPTGIFGGLPCPKCGANNPLEAKFCYADGMSLTGQRRRDPRPDPFPDPFPEPYPDPLPDPPALLLLLTSMCDQEQPDWEEILSTAESVRLEGIPIPPAYDVRVREAERRVRCSENLGRAIAGGALADIISSYVPELLDDWKRCERMVARARRALQQKARIGEIAAFLQAGKIDAALKAWAPAKSDLVDVEEASAIAAQIRLCEQIAADKPSEQKIAAIAAELARLGIPLSDALEQRVEKARQFVDAVSDLLSGDEALSEEADRRLVAAWPRMVGCKQAEDYRARFDEARRRLGAVNDLTPYADCADENEQALVEAADHASLPTGYDHRHRKRIEKARLRSPLFVQLAEALAAKRPSDLAIALHAKALRQNGATLTPAQDEACKAATRRAVVLVKLREIDRTPRADEQDRRWAELWDEKLLAGRADADRYRARAKLAFDRLAKFEELTAALTKNDYLRGAQLVDDPLLADYPALDEHQETIDRFRHWAAKIRQIRSLLEAKDPIQFVEKVDFSLLRSQPDLFRSHWSKIELLATEWLDRAEVLKASASPSKYGPDNRLEAVQWMWPLFDRVTFCWVSIDPNTFYEKPEDDPNRLEWDAESYRAAGSAVPIPSFGLRQLAWVTVWPVLELGWKKLVGRPLKLGPVKMRRKPGGDSRGGGSSGGYSGTSHG
jgi:hypothetical protein